MDVFDQATETERLHREAALSVAAMGRDPDPGPEWIDGKPCCRECGEEIPRARLDAAPGCGVCVECAREAETHGAA